MTFPTVPTPYGPVSLPELESPAEAIFEAMGEKAGLPTLKTVEKAAIARTLRITNGNKTKSAEALGIDRRTLYRKLVKFGLL